MQHQITQPRTVFGNVTGAIPGHERVTSVLTLIASVILLLGPVSDARADGRVAWYTADEFQTRTRHRSEPVVRINDKVSIIELEGLKRTARIRRVWIEYKNGQRVRSRALEGYLSRGETRSVHLGRGRFVRDIHFEVSPVDNRRAYVAVNYRTGADGRVHHDQRFTNTRGHRHDSGHREPRRSYAAPLQHAIQRAFRSQNRDRSHARGRDNQRNERHDNRPRSDRGNGRSGRTHNSGRQRDPATHAQPRSQNQPARQARNARPDRDRTVRPRPNRSANAERPQRPARVERPERRKQRENREPRDNCERGRIGRIESPCR